MTPPPDATAHGTIVNTLALGGVFAQAVWADNKLIIATQNNGLQAYGPP